MINMTSAVTRPSPASSDLALKHFTELMTFETDCWDVNHAITNNKKDFVLLDVRGEMLFEQGHIQTSYSLPHSRINLANLEKFPDDSVYVIYCAGPHCNATEKAAIKLATLGKPVKKMIGGVTGWIDEGFTLTDQG